MAVVELQADVELIKHAFDQQKNFFQELRKEPIAARKERLNRLREWIHKNRSAIHKAMHDDFRKPSAEVDAIEIFHVLNEIKHAVTHLDDWAAPKKIDAPITLIGTRSWIHYEPRGVCLIISPWNYPFSLAVGPLVSALAAGNSAIIKPSEHTPNVSALLKKMVADIFDAKVVTVFEGDALVSQHLLKLPFDHIFFTGSPAIGKVVMKAAAENLSSITLELGGKSPTIVTASANLNDAAERIAVAKFVNNGQTCIAPDYLLVDEKVEQQLIAKLKLQVQKQFSVNGDFERCESYCRIVNARHFTRLKELMEDAINQGARVELSGDMNEGSRFFHPVILSNVSSRAKLMNEEIFGPIMPIISYKTLDEAIATINSKPKPLALYIYSGKSSEKNRILKETSAGGVCVNDSGVHFLHHNLPFGGVNNSGIGKSHGHYGFLAFSNEKPVMQQKSGFTTVKMFYPPYTSRSGKLLDWFLKFF
jgi:aldehyde dehydrogenase (NAD+)